MKSPSSFLTNTTTPTGRSQGAAKNNPGDNTGTGADKEIYNDPAYANIAVIESYKEGGISDTDETTTDSDMRDALEEMVAKKVDGVDEWDAGTTYLAPTLVMRKGLQFYGFNTTGNLSKDPLMNPNYWFYAGKPEDLLAMYYDGSPQNGGLNNIANRDSANYKQNALVGKYRLGGNGDTFYEFYRVALDGTQVTGNTTLEDIFSGYYNIDLVAPDSIGTRTLIDLGESNGTSYIIVIKGA